MKREKMGKAIPKVKFSIASIEKIMPMIHFFLNPEEKQWDWSNSIYKKYPKLKKKLKNIKDKTKRREIECKFFKNKFFSDKSLLEKKRLDFQREWNKINDKIMIALSEIIEQQWTENDKSMKARISLNPICPRYIKQRTFDLYYKSPFKEMKGTAIHEILHFIYFKKWKIVFPKTKEKEFDAPYLVWQLSEMVPGIVLNDERIQKVLRYNFKSYKIYHEFKINNKPLLSYLQNFYDKRVGFNDFLRKSWKFVNEHKKEINSL